MKHCGLANLIFEPHVELAALRINILATMASLRILVADDHDVIRHGIRALLVERPERKVCGEAKTGTEAIFKVDELKPDIVILDIQTPDLDGLEAARRILAAADHTEILIVSMHASDHLVRECVKAGVRGYIVKSDAMQDLPIAVETIRKHQPFFSSRATEVILGSYNLGGRIADAPGVIRGRLTTREREIVQLLAVGESSKDVATHLNITVKTVDTHRANIMRKLDPHSVTELVRYAVRNQIVKP